MFLILRGQGTNRLISENPDFLTKFASKLLQCREIPMRKLNNIELFSAFLEFSTLRKEVRGKNFAKLRKIEICEHNLTLNYSAIKKNSHEETRFEC